MGIPQKKKKNMKITKKYLTRGIFLYHISKNVFNLHGIKKYYKMKTKKIYRQETKVTIDNNTGEIIQETDVTKSIVECEPNFIKMYVNDILKLKDVPKASNDVLNVLLANMSYQNIVVMIKPIKNLICEQTGLKSNTVNKAIQNLHKAGILIRKDRSVYIVDPTLFAKGKWEDIKKLRLVIDYKPNGTKEINSNMVEQLKLKI